MPCKYSVKTTGKPLLQTLTITHVAVEVDVAAPGVAVPAGAKVVLALLAKLEAATATMGHQQCVRITHEIACRVPLSTLMYGQNCALVACSMSQCTILLVTPKQGTELMHLLRGMMLCTLADMMTGKHVPNAW